MRFWSSLLVLIASWLFAAPFASAAARPMGCAVESDAKLHPTVGPRAPRVDLPSQSIARRAGLGEIGAVLRSTTGDSDGDDDLVVQDEAPAAQIDAGDGVAPALQPLGTLTSSRDALPAHRILSRTSPRGPPAF